MLCGYQTCVPLCGGEQWHRRCEHEAVDGDQPLPALAPVLALPSKAPEAPCQYRRGCEQAAEEYSRYTHVDECKVCRSHHRVIEHYDLRNLFLLQHIQGI